MDGGRKCCSRQSCRLMRSRSRNDQQQQQQQQQQQIQQLQQQQLSRQQQAPLCQCQESTPQRQLSRQQQQQQQQQQLAQLPADTTSGASTQILFVEPNFMETPSEYETFYDCYSDNDVTREASGVSQVVKDIEDPQKFRGRLKHVACTTHKLLKTFDEASKRDQRCRGCLMAMGDYVQSTGSRSMVQSKTCITHGKAQGTVRVAVPGQPAMEISYEPISVTIPLTITLQSLSPSKTTAMTAPMKASYNSAPPIEPTCTSIIATSTAASTVASGETSRSVLQQSEQLLQQLEYESGDGNTRLEKKQTFCPCKAGKRLWSAETDEKLVIRDPIKSSPNEDEIVSELVIADILEKLPESPKQQEEVDETSKATESKSPNALSAPKKKCKCGRSVEVVDPTAERNLKDTPAMSKKCACGRSVELVEPTVGGKSIDTPSVPKKCACGRSVEVVESTTGSKLKDTPAMPKNCACGRSVEVVEPVVEPKTTDTSLGSKKCACGGRSLIVSSTAQPKFSQASSMSKYCSCKPTNEVIPLAVEPKQKKLGGKSVEVIPLAVEPSKKCICGRPGEVIPPAVEPKNKCICGRSIEVIPPAVEPNEKCICGQSAEEIPNVVEPAKVPTSLNKVPQKGVIPEQTSAIAPSGEVVPIPVKQSKTSDKSKDMLAANSNVGPDGQGSTSIPKSMPAERGAVAEQKSTNARSGEMLPVPAKTSTTSGQNKCLCGKSKNLLAATSNGAPEMQKLEICQCGGTRMTQGTTPTPTPTQTTITAPGSTMPTPKSTTPTKMLTPTNSSIKKPCQCRGTHMTQGTTPTPSTTPTSTTQAPKSTTPTKMLTPTNSSTKKPCQCGAPATPNIQKPSLVTILPPKPVPPPKPLKCLCGTKATTVERPKCTCGSSAKPAEPPRPQCTCGHSAEKSHPSLAKFQQPPPPCSCGLGMSSPGTQPDSFAPGTKPTSCSCPNAQPPKPKCTCEPIITELDDPLYPRIECECENPPPKVDCPCLDETLPICSDSLERTICKCMGEVPPKPPPKPVRLKFRIALPQHKDLHLCTPCRYDPSPLMDDQGHVFCPFSCGCCLCPWKIRASESVEDKLKHTKIKVCKCRERGNLFDKFSRKVIGCSNDSFFDVCPCREKAEAKFLEMYGLEMYTTDERLRDHITGKIVTLDEIVEVTPPPPKVTHF